MIKPDCYKHIGKIINAIENSGFVISNIKMTKMAITDSQQFYAEHKVNSMTFGGEFAENAFRRFAL